MHCLKLMREPISMRVIVWNLNHRASAAIIQDWVEVEIVRNKPNVVILTEYVDGADHKESRIRDSHLRFRRGLSDAGLRYISTTDTERSRRFGANQVLIATEQSHSLGGLIPPQSEISNPGMRERADERIRAGFLHVTLACGLEVIGFRQRIGPEVRRKEIETTQNHLLAAMEQLSNSQAIIAGDFNTKPTSTPGIRFFDKIRKLDWKWGDPGPGATSFGPSLIDHAFLSPSISEIHAICDWGFIQRLPVELRAKRIPRGLPDHAMLLVDFVHPASSNARRISTICPVTR